MSSYPIVYATKERREELRSMPYAEYLQTPEWMQARWFALCRDGFSCVMCAATEPLHVHHRRYDYRGEERPDDLVTVCESCHSKHHGVGVYADGVTERPGSPLPDDNTFRAPDDKTPWTQVEWTAVLRRFEQRMRDARAAYEAATTDTDRAAAVLSVACYAWLPWFREGSSTNDEKFLRWFLPEDMDPKIGPLPELKVERAALKAAGSKHFWYPKPTLAAIGSWILEYRRKGLDEIAASLTVERDEMFRAARKASANGRRAA